ncbi:hypothetical protein GMRT_15271 [Giardia muris]|uniref:STL11/RBM22-like N-terminal domain-containing protein n=1 Tax=Giardia muris TaxID=5742 RepID=A0A4Z1T5S3_GIAMU|nr:hypothetical protein GMRT_15271 [Giardia muris]|eukprot:TNJ27879.1 hypothetical protein GMRT_15271 [Giardia muris]
MLLCALCTAYGGREPVLKRRVQRQECLLCETPFEGYHFYQPERWGAKLSLLICEECAGLRASCQACFNALDGTGHERMLITRKSILNRVDILVENKRLKYGAFYRSVVGHLSLRLSTAGAISPEQVLTCYREVSQQDPNAHHIVLLFRVGANELVPQEVLSTLGSYLKRNRLSLCLLISQIGKPYETLMGERVEPYKREFVVNVGCLTPSFGISRFGIATEHLFATYILFRELTIWSIQPEIVLGKNTPESMRDFATHPTISFTLSGSSAPL